MVSNDPQTLRQSGWVLARDGSPDVVRYYAQAVAETRPNSIAALTTAAWMANDIEDTDLGVELMQRVLTLDASNFDAMNYIGYMWAEQGRNLEEAEAHIRQAISLRGDDGNILDSLAWVHFRQGRYDDALAVQLHAIELVGDNAILWDHLGDIYDALGQTEDALHAWFRALELADERDEDVIQDASRKIEQAEGRGGGLEPNPSGPVSSPEPRSEELVGEDKGPSLKPLSGQSVLRQGRRYRPHAGRRLAGGASRSGD